MVTEVEFVLCWRRHALDREPKQDLRPLRTIADKTVTGESEAALDFVAERPSLFLQVQPDG